MIMINIIITIVTKIWNFDTVVGDRNGTYALQKLVCWWWLFDWSFAYLIAPVLTTISIILIANKIQTGDVLISAYQGCPGKWLLNECHVVWQYIFNVFMCVEQLAVPVDYCCHLLFWSQKPTIFIVWSDSRWPTASSNAVWHSLRKCVRHSTNSQVHRTRMNDNYGAVCNWLQIHIFTGKTIAICSDSFSFKNKNLTSLKFVPLENTTACILDELCIPTSLLQH